MTTFGWKRKAGQNLLKEPAVKLSDNLDEDQVSSNIEWLKSIKRRKQLLNETCEEQSQNHKVAGIGFAENNRFEEAVAEWDKALNLVPHDYKILEMKAQALLQLSKPFPAIQAAEKALMYNPIWWIGYQTLGRSQLGMGDLEMAKRSFSKAIHLNPAVEELWEEDLKFTIELIKKEKELKKEENT